MTSITESTANWALNRRMAIVSEAQTGSTNDNAKSNAFSESADTSLYLASHQTAGRGRGHNQWLDTGAGESLLLTWSVALNSPPQAITAPRIGLALHSAVSRSWPALNWSLKAPNDLILGGLKVAGLLVESISSGSSRHRLLIGLGFNILNHPRRLPDATHLLDSLDAGLDEPAWFRFLDELRTRFAEAVKEVTESHLSDAARHELKAALNAHPGKSFTVREVSINGDLIHDGGTVRWTDL